MKISHCLFSCLHAANHSSKSLSNIYQIIFDLFTISGILWWSNDECLRAQVESNQALYWSGCNSYDNPSILKHWYFHYKIPLSCHSTMKNENIMSQLYLYFKYCKLCKWRINFSEYIYKLIISISSVRIVLIFLYTSSTIVIILSNRKSIISSIDKYIHQSMCGDNR